MKEKRYNEAQIQYLESLGFTYHPRIEQWSKQYGPDGGSYIWVSYQGHASNYHSHILMDRNVFLPGANECYDEFQKIKDSKLFYFKEDKL